MAKPMPGRQLDQCLNDDDDDDDDAIITIIEFSAIQS